MTKKASRIYFAIAPVLFFLSWFISHRLYKQFMVNAVQSADIEKRSLVYASVFTGLYLVVWFVIQDLYKPKS